MAALKYIRIPSYPGIQDKPATTFQLLQASTAERCECPESTDTLRPGTRSHFSQDISPHTHFLFFTLVNVLFFLPYVAISAGSNVRRHILSLSLRRQSAWLFSCHICAARYSTFAGL
jgi:hypothetical protein